MFLNNGRTKLISGLLVTKAGFYFIRVVGFSLFVGFVDNKKDIISPDKKTKSFMQCSLITCSQSATNKS